MIDKISEQLELEAIEKSSQQTSRVEEDGEGELSQKRNSEQLRYATFLTTASKRYFGNAPQPPSGNNVEVNEDYAVPPSPENSPVNSESDIDEEFSTTERKNEKSEDSDESLIDTSTTLIGSKRKTPSTPKRDPPSKKSSANDGIPKPILATPRSATEKRSNKKKQEDDFELSLNLNLNTSKLRRRYSGEALANISKGIAKDEKIVFSCAKQQIYAKQVLKLPYNYFFTAGNNYKIREPDENQIEKTVKSLKGTPVGMFLSFSKLFVVLEPITKKSAVVPLNFADLEPLLLRYDDTKEEKAERQFKLVVLCGNTRILAMRRIAIESIKNKKLQFFKDIQLQFDLYYNLSIPQALALAAEENVTASNVNTYTLAQQVKFIYDRWQNPLNLEKDKSGRTVLNNDTKYLLVKDIINDPKVSGGDMTEVKLAQVYNSNNPLFKACNLSPEMFTLVHPLLESNILKKQSFINLMNIKDKTVIVKILKELSEEKINKQKAADILKKIDRYKWTEKIIESIFTVIQLSELATGSEIALMKKKFKDVFGDKDTIYTAYCQFFKQTFGKVTHIPSYDSITSGLGSKKLIKTFPESFEKFVKHKVAEFRNSEETEKFSKVEIKELIEGKNITKCSTCVLNTTEQADIPCEQYVFKNDATTVECWTILEKLVENAHTNCSLIILDPPFGLLGTEHSWDEEFSTKKFQETFELAHKTFPYAAFLIFHSDGMIPEIFKAIQKHKFTNYVLGSYYTAGKKLKNYQSSIAFLSQFYTICCKDKIWPFNELIDPITKEPLNPLLRTNFRYVNRFTKTASDKTQVVNPTEKSIALLRSLIVLFSTPGHIVIDPMCGSGTTSEACLSLNISSISVDIRDDQVEATIIRATSCISRLESTPVTELYLPIDSCCRIGKKEDIDDQVAAAVEDVLGLQVEHKPANVANEKKNAQEANKNQEAEVKKKESEVVKKMKELKAKKKEQKSKPGKKQTQDETEIIEIDEQNKPGQEEAQDLLSDDSVDRVSEEENIEKIGSDSSSDE